MRFDTRDLEILLAPSTDGGMAKTALAERVGPSPSPCWGMLKKLEKGDLVPRCRAENNLQKTAPNVTIFVTVEPSDFTAVCFRAFTAVILHHDQVLACWALGGRFDYFLQIVMRDLDTYQRLIKERLEARVGLGRYFNYVVTKPVKGRDEPPIFRFAGWQDQTSFLEIVGSRILCMDFDTWPHSSRKIPGIVRQRRRIL